MWEIIAGTAAGVLGVLIMWVGSGYLDLNLNLHPYYQRHLHGEQVAEGDGDIAATLADEDKDSRIGTGEMKVSYAVKGNESETTVEKVDWDKDITLVQHEHDVGSRDRSRSRSRQVFGDAAAAGGAGGGFFLKKRELVNMSGIP